ncbi:MAG: dimethyl sulfoxide reductase anchor subunit [Alphaproteobacteria bacterium]|nr:dimethyl sulfoxide reductase anchor subunit [Alphaproteobacteria bacterium]
MNPTVATIFFTTASGAGYGLIALMAIFQASGILPTNPKLGLVGFTIAFALITVGLVAPVLRPGRLSQAWAAAGQWHTSWRGRTVAFALLTYPPAGAYAAGWYADWRPDYLTAVGMVAAMLCMQTVYCTAMIYTSRKTIRAWSNAWVPTGFFGLSILTGALILHALTAAFGYFNSAYFWVSTLAIVFAGVVKMRYWQMIDRDLPVSPPAAAIDPDDPEQPADAPDPADTAEPAPQNYLLEGRYHIFARAYADKLRQLAIAAAFMAPILLITLANVSPAASAVTLTTLATLVALFGVLIERWLFFAEAQEAAGA